MKVINDCGDEVMKVFEVWSRRQSLLPSWIPRVDQIVDDPEVGKIQRQQGHLRN